MYIDPNEKDRRKREELKWKDQEKVMEDIVEEDDVDEFVVAVWYIPIEFHQD